MKILILKKVYEIMDNNLQWKYITDLSCPNIIKNRYLISNNGLVYDSANNRYVKIFTDEEGYYRFYYRNNDNKFKQAYIHRVVKIEYDGFDSDPEKNQIDHIYCDKSDNCPEHLEWVTKQENALRAIKNNRYHQFDVKLSEDDVRFICGLLKQGKSYKYISDQLQNKFDQDISGMIGKIYRFERWKHISKDYIPFPELEKDPIIPPNAILNEEIVHDICQYLSNNNSISDTAKYIQSKYNISTDLRNSIGFIKQGRTWKHISCDYNLGGNNVNKPTKNENINFEESIRNYGNKIEHIETFVAAVRRLPGKPIYCLAYQK